MVFTISELRQSIFSETSWAKFDYDHALASWVEHAKAPAQQSVVASVNRHWYRHGGTWFVGVNALSNDTQGKVEASGVLAGQAVRWLRDYVKTTFEPPSPTVIEWDRAQISVCYPGYPGKDPEETEAAHRFRVRRDAAHVDGLLREGSDGARYVREHHAFIFGIPVSEFSRDAAPFVVWEGSHRIIQQRLQAHFARLPEQQWFDDDISDVYSSARKEVFERCKRTEIYAQKGESFIVHRLAVHGMAPWAKSATCDALGRVICYFRPQIITAQQWLNAD